MKVGLVLLRAEWFDSVVALPELAEKVAQDADDIVNALRTHFTIAGHWVVSSREGLSYAENALRTIDVDLMILAFQVWAEDSYLIPLLNTIGDQPLAVWCYLPWERPPRPTSFVEVLRGSGPVGTFEGLGVIRNLKRDFVFTAGSSQNPRVIRELVQAASAGKARRLLQKARFGILPYRNAQMQTTFVDESRLRAELGPEMQYFSVRELEQIAEKLHTKEVITYVDELHERFTIQRVSDETLIKAARVSLGLAHLAALHDLDLISLNDIAQELHDVFGMRPCLYPPLLDETNVLVGIEGDMGAAVAMFVLNRITASPILFAETWFWDEVDNLVITGHAGPQNPSLANPGSAWISHDYEFAQVDRTEGANIQFVARPGRVTLFQVRATPDGWQAIVTTGEAIESEPWVEGYPHAVIRLDAPVVEFLHQVASVGSTQHWAVAYGDVLDETALWCRFSSIPLLAIR